MVTSKTKLVEIYEKHLREHFANPRNPARDKCIKEIFQSPAFDHINKSKLAHKLNAFVSELMANILTEVLTERGEEIISVITNDFKYVVENLFTEDEAKTICDFASSDIGKKLIRNVDLLKEGYDKGNVILNMEVLSRWSKPEFGAKIIEFLEKEFDEDEDLT